MCVIRPLRERHEIIFSLDVCAISCSMFSYHTHLYDNQLFCKLLTYKLSNN